MNFYLFKNHKKMGFIFRRTHGGHVAHGTRADATRHARPSGRASQAHAARSWSIGGGDAWQGHTSPRGCTGGTTWREGWQVKGPRVSGPWLVYWGGNARALVRLTLYTHQLPKFLPSGTMFPRNSLSLQDTWWKETHRMRSRGPESTRSLS